MVHYPHKYKFGKQEDVMELDWFREAMLQAEAAGEPQDKLAFLVLLWYGGPRKSEAYEMELEPHENVTVKENFVMVDFGRNYGVEKGQRKKHGDKTGFLSFPRGWFGFEEWLVPHICSRIADKPPRKYSKKTIRYQVDTGKTKTKRFPGGREKTVPDYEWREEKIRAVYLFPHINRSNSQQLVKRVFGEQYYTHYFRLRANSAVGTNPATASYGHIRSFSGIKTMKSQQAYMGRSKRAKNEAILVAGEQNLNA